MLSSYLPSSIRCKFMVKITAVKSLVASLCHISTTISVTWRTVLKISIHTAGKEESVSIRQLRVEWKMEVFYWDPTVRNLLATRLCSL